MTSNNNNFDMMMLRLPKLQGNKVKVEKTQDYYNVFLSILKAEDKSIRNNRHYWVIGIDKAGYIVCIYIFSIDPEDLMKVSLRKIFRLAIMSEASDVVLAYNVKDDESLVPSPENVAFFNRTFNFSDYVTDLNVLDMMVISKNGYHSDKEDGYFDFYTRDMSFKIYDDVKDKVKCLKRKYGRKKEFEGMTKGFDKGKREEKIEMVKTMLEKKYTLEQIVEISKLSIEEIERIKKEIGL